MESIINFYEANEKDLLDYDKETINKLYKIIINTKNNLNNIDWFNNCSAIIEECVKIFSVLNYDYVYYIDYYIQKLKQSIPDNIDMIKLKSDHHYTIKKVNLYIKMLEYIKSLNYNDNIFFDKDKYNIIIDTYCIFCNLNEDICESIIEFYYNNYIIFYSKSSNYINVCIYHLDDLFGHKLFLTFRKNNITNKIKIYTYDTLFNTQEDFYKKIKMYDCWKIPDYPRKKNILQFININQIAECFSKKNNPDIEIMFFESNFVDVNKMLQYVKEFLNN